MKGAITLESNKGETFEQFSTRLINLVAYYYAHKKKNAFVQRIVGVFEGVRLVATKSATTDRLQTQYDRQLIKSGKQIILEAKCGEHVDSFAERLVSRWEYLATRKNNQFAVTGTFNGTNLIATGKQTPKMLSDHYSNECKKQSDAYRKTDAYKEQQRKMNEEVSDLQNLYNGLIVTLPALDFNNYNDVLDFTSRYRTATDHRHVTKDHSIFIKALEDNGYVANENSGENFKEYDEENNARYIIGQFIDCVKKDGACPQAFDIFYKRYVDKFRQVTV